MEQFGFWLLFGGTVLGTGYTCMSRTFLKTFTGIITLPSSFDHKQCWHHATVSIICSQRPRMWRCPGAEVAGSTKFLLSTLQTSEDDFQYVDDIASPLFAPPAHFFFEHRFRTILLRHNQLLQVCIYIVWSCLCCLFPPQALFLLLGGFVGSRANGEWIVDHCRLPIIVLVCEHGKYCQDWDKYRDDRRTVQGGRWLERPSYLTWKFILSNLCDQIPITLRAGKAIQQVVDQSIQANWVMSDSPPRPNLSLPRIWTQLDISTAQ